MIPAGKYIGYLVYLPAVKLTTVAIYYDILFISWLAPSLYHTNHWLAGSSNMEHQLDADSWNLPVMDNQLIGILTWSPIGQTIVFIKFDMIE